jgi:lipoprotein NlpD
VKRWRWPARGKVVTSFSASGRKGIDIEGRFGQTVMAAAGGRVVYSGSGLIGYGQLIIVKHNKRYLSAYAHNNKLLVKEGDAVKGGQRIAEMGRSGPNRALLHFEIRRDGKPIDPLRYLPK